MACSCKLYRGRSQTKHQYAHLRVKDHSKDFLNHVKYLQIMTQLATSEAKFFFSFNSFNTLGWIFNPTFLAFFGFTQFCLLALWLASMKSNPILILSLNMGLNPVQAWCFLGSYFCNCLSCIHSCDGLLSIYIVDYHWIKIIMVLACWAGSVPSTWNLRHQTFIHIYFKPSVPIINWLMLPIHN